MRRRDRELSRQEAYEILEQGEYGVLSMVDAQGEPYAVPINYALDGDDIILHMTMEESQKTEAMRAHARVSFVVVGPTEVLPAKFSCAYASAIAMGVAEEITDGEAKQQALYHFLPKYTSEFMEKGKAYIAGEYKETGVWRIHIDVLTGKARKKKKAAAE